VLSPDPALKFGQIRLPEFWAPLLTIEEIVSSYNLPKIQRIAREGKINHIVPSTGQFEGKMVEWKKDWNDKPFKIKIGDKVHRHLMNGDMVIFNRQPTLHKESFMAYEVVLGSPLTIGLHMSYTTPANADFDGDTAAVSVPQTAEAQAELREMLNVKQCILDGQRNKAMMGLVYNVATGTYQLTNYWNVYGIDLKLLERTLKYRNNTKLDKALRDNDSNVLFDILKEVVPASYPQDYKISVDDQFILSSLYTGKALIPILSKIYPNKYREGYIVTNEDLKYIEDIKDKIESGDNSYILQRITKREYKKELDDKDLKKINDVLDKINNEEYIDVLKMFRPDIYPGDYELSEQDINILSNYSEKKGINVRVDKDVYNDVLMSITNLPDLKDFEQRLKQHGVAKYSGNGMYSLVFPRDFYYERDSVKIINGIVISGPMTKNHVGPSSNSVVQIIAQRYGLERAAQFITDASYLVQTWMNANPLTVGIEDCTPIDKEQVKKVEDDIAKTRLLVESFGSKSDDPIEESIRQKNIKLSLMGVVNTAGSRVLKEKMDIANPLHMMATSKAKGSVENVAQMTSLVGQQFFQGERIKSTMSEGTRCLPYFPENDESIEARGFCVKSYTEGLSPDELIFQQMAGRQGLMDTALNTAETGFLHRKMVKALEDVKVSTDGSVRNANNVIFQYAYGEDGLDPSQMRSFNIGANSVVSFINLNELANEINSTYYELPDVIEPYNVVQLPRVERKEVQQDNVQDSDVIPENEADITLDKVTNPRLTKFERARLIGARANQLNKGAKARVNVRGMTDTLKIAEKELKERKIPLVVKRYLPDGRVENWFIEEFIFDE
jgi:DNA-directed RNA polymerase beta' subunit/DNA-directed RNA polymerase subunit K/omega